MAESTLDNEGSNQRLAWYHQAKFGLFLHWGAYSAAGVEASWPIMTPDLSDAMFGARTRITEEEYRALPGRFNPVEFDADVWVHTAHQSGMRYIVFTAKHHDGFCMFDAPGTDYKITNTPFGRDICLELAQACARVGMPLGFYYSPPDMHHPGYRDTRKPTAQNWLGEPKRKEWAQYLDYMESHIRALLTGYGEVSILWFDGLVNHAKYDPPRFHQLIHSLSPHTLINDRLGDDYDYITPEQFIPKAGIPVRTGRPPSGNDPGGDSFFRAVTSLYKIPGLHGIIGKQLQKYQNGTLELTPVLQEAYPTPDRFQPWETCMTMGRSWSFNPAETDWKTPQKLLRSLVEVSSRGGNFLLNVGPTAQGTFPPEALERLDYIGCWMAKYGESIFSSTYTPLQAQLWGRASRQGSRLYLHVFDWPKNGDLEVGSFPVKAHSVRLTGGETLAYTQNEQQLRVHLPTRAPDADVSVIEVEIDPADPGLANYSTPVDIRTPAIKYLQTQVKISAVANALINGLIAFFSYRLRSSVPAAEAAVDIPITVFIISFLVSWLVLIGVRQQVASGKLSMLPVVRRGIRLPHGAALGALVITAVCVIMVSLVLDGLIHLLAPGGFAGWAYIIFKTLYTGGAAALACALAILRVFYEEKRRSYAAIRERHPA
jgi:alpha-L-fucosidase